ncbi:hypothetical protein SDC9_11485 [bioreactor metagenome]|uniref:Porin domain-containing protein n=1 Tax=bioreactor metagenome TaxID=1076179 RepID=A0A644TJD0_9ZZZZ|nr:hypothetical protein [Negativicutes bacterium]
MKKVIALLALGTSLFAATAAFAAPVNLNGETSVKYVHEDFEGESSQTGMVYTLKLMAEAELNKNLSVYTRLGAQRTRQNQVGSDFNPDAYSNKRSVLELDQYGFIFNDNDWVYKLGRQDATVGATALLYSRSDSNIGKHNFVDGFSMSGTAGVLDMNALLAREDNVGHDKSRVYALHTGYTISDNMNVGLTLGRFHGSTVPSTNHWAVDGTYQLGRNSWTAEFANSSSSSDNKAYAVAWNYDVDDKTAVSVTGFRVEANGDMGGQTDFENDSRGVHYAIAHSLKDDTVLELVVKDEKNLTSRANNKTYEITLGYSF